MFEAIDREKSAREQQHGDDAEYREASNADQDRAERRAIDRGQADCADPSGERSAIMNTRARRCPDSRGILCSVQLVDSLRHSAHICQFADFDCRTRFVDTPSREFGEPFKCRKSVSRQLLAGAWAYLEIVAILAGGPAA
ncbi:MAG: hypothetical protein AB7G15_07735 [Alphaproteobacteria bacterium]